jgi:DHA3 family macrolide efflux protein-like MFS transporter
MTSAKWYETGNWKIPFFTIWIGQAFSLLGSSLVQFALVWWLTEKTGSATVLATATLVALLPQIFFSPIAGTLVDRWNRRVVMIAADALGALATLVLVLLFAFHAAHVWHIYVIMLVRSLGGAFHWPAMQASTSLMVPKDQLSRISGLNQMLWGAMSIIAPPLGALLLDVLPMQGVLAIDIVTASIAIAIISVLAIPQPERKNKAENEPKPSVFQDLREGLRYVRGWPGLMIILFMATMINFLFNPAFSLLPLLVTDHFGGKAMELGWMNSAWGVGVISGGALLSIWGGFKRKLYTSMTGLIGMGLAVAVIGLSPSSAFALALVAMVIGGIMNPITNGPLQAVLQSSVAPDMQGRVFTLVTASATAMSPLSLMVAGPVSDALGIQVWYVTAGAFCALMGAVGFFIPALASMEDQKAVSVEDAAAAVVETLEDLVPSTPSLEPSLDR